MKYNDWSDDNEAAESGRGQPQRRQRGKQRKWREIEETKERQRMRRELLEYNVCDLDYQLAQIFV